MSSPAPETPPGTNSTAASPPSPSAASPPSPVASTPTTNVTASPPSPALVSTAPTSVNSTPFMPLTPADSGGLAKGTLTGIIIGAVLGSTAMLIIGGIFVFFYRRAKRKRNQGFEKSNYYGALPQPKVDQGSGLPQQWQSTPSPSTDGKGGLPPKPPGVVANHQKSSSAGSLPTYSSATSSGIGSERPYMSQSSGMSLSLSQSTFTYDELAMATEGFSGSNLLGQGGFGYVHKGVLPNGKTVAVKQLKSESKQGEREFHAEVDVISRVHHRHLVSLVGYCVSGGPRGRSI